MWFNNLFFIQPRKYSCSSEQPIIIFPREFSISGEEKTLRACSDPITGPKD